MYFVDDYLTTRNDLSTIHSVSQFFNAKKKKSSKLLSRIIVKNVCFRNAISRVCVLVRGKCLSRKSDAIVFSADVTDLRVTRASIFLVVPRKANIAFRTAS